jgi:CheY-like chemotaxis protein
LLSVLAQKGDLPLDLKPRADEIKKPRLLLVEDDQETTESLRWLFRLSNYELDTAEDGQKAVEMWEGGKYDLILMDVQMPRMNGFEAIAAIREKERTCGGHTPVIAMTGMHKFFSTDMDAYISKPVDFKECLKLVEETILWSRSK